MNQQEIYLENRRKEINKRFDDAIEEARSDVVMPPIPEYKKMESGVFKSPAGIHGFISSILP